MANASRIVTKTAQALNNRIIKSPPAAWQALLAHPPPPSLIRDAPKRTSEDLSPTQRNAQAASSTRRRKPGREYKARLKPQPIVWDEDAIVERLLADHPWERHRPITVTESDELSSIVPKGDGKELASWSRNPSIYLTARYVLHLRDAFKLPLAQAYSTAVAQFRSLKATLEAATRFAQLEAESYGADFGSGRIGAGVKAEEKMLDLWDAQHGASSSNDNSTSLSAILANSGVDQTPQSLPWTRAKDYLQGMHFRESPAAEAKPSGDTEAEVPAAESVLSATRLMDVMGGGASKRERRPTEQPRGPKRQSSEARQTNRERQTHRAVNHMIGIKR